MNTVLLSILIGIIIVLICAFLVYAIIEYEFMDYVVCFLGTVGIIALISKAVYQLIS